MRPPAGFRQPEYPPGDPRNTIFIGAATEPTPDTRAKEAEPLIDPDSFTAGGLAGTAIGVLCGAVLGYALVEASLQAHRFYQGLRATPAGEPAIERAIPCPGPGLNERTYIVLSNAQGHIRIDTCVTTHILGS
jgi:hypothetical protein